MLRRTRCTGRRDKGSYSAILASIHLKSRDQTQRIFPRDVSKVKKGRCSYQFACYHDGGMITDGLLLRVGHGRYWFAQADGDLFSWYKAHAEGLDVAISDPDVWVSQIQGPRSMELLGNLIDGSMPEPWRYFDWVEVSVAGE